MTREAAVLIVSATVDGQDSILLTRRARHLNSHGGEVALPGGMREASDSSLRATALRETEEEVALAAQAVEICGELPPNYTRHGVRVTPFYGRTEQTQGLRPEPGEIEAIFWMPTALLSGDLRVRTDIFTQGEREYWAPVYHFRDFVIWGFTARVLVDFANRCLGCTIVRQHAAPQRRHSPR